MAKYSGMQTVGGKKKTTNARGRAKRDPPGGNQHIPKSVCDVDLRFLPPFPGTALIQYVVLCSDTSDIMNPMYAHIYTYTYLF